MVGAPLPSAQLAGSGPTAGDAGDTTLSGTKHALAHEAALRLALRDVADTLPEADATERAAAVARVTNAALPDELVTTRPLLRAMRDAVLNAATAAPSAGPSPSSSGLIAASPAATAGSVDRDENDGEDDDGDDGKDDGGKDENNAEADNGNQDDADGEKDADGENNADEDEDEDMAATSPTPTLMPQTSVSSISAPMDPVARAARALDDFVSVSVIGARAKASAFFDQMIVHTEWTRIGVVAGSSVAEAAFLAVNHPKKSLTVLDVPPRWPGRALADKLAWQTGASVRYAAVTAAHRALEGIDVVVMGAREVLANGFVVVDGGASVVAHMAQEAGVPVVVTAQAAKVSERASVEWTEDDADIIKAREVQRLVTELDSALPERAGVWRTDLAPEVVKKREAGSPANGFGLLTN